MLKFLREAFHFLNDRRTLTHTYIHTYVYVDIYIYTNTCIYIYIYIYINTHFMHTHTYKHTHKYTQTYIYIYIYCILYIFAASFVSTNLDKNNGTFLYIILLCSLMVLLSELDIKQYISPTHSNNIDKFTFAKRPKSLIITPEISNNTKNLYNDIKSRLQIIKNPK